MPLGGFLLLVFGVVWGSLVILCPLTAVLPLMGSPSYCASNPFGLRETHPHLMPVEQGLPWHPVATGLAGLAS